MNSTQNRAHDVPIARIPPSPSIRTWSERHGFTPELVARWVTFLPEPKRLLESLLRDVPRYLRVNTLRTDKHRLMASLTKRGFKLTDVESPHPDLQVLRINNAPFAPSSTPEHLAGECYLQDLASLTAAAALTPQRGERILDMAAAPGGKTTAIAEMVRDQASILAVEPVPHRAAALTANLRRLGIEGVGVLIERGENVPAIPGGFDRILLDAPCTGEGVLPRDRNRRIGDLEEHATLATLQRGLIDHAITLLKPGGTLVYSTCTFAPEECESAVRYAVNAGLEPQPLPFTDLNGVTMAQPLAEADGVVYGDAVRHARRAYPHRHKTLGFFVARLEKPTGAAGVAVTEAATERSTTAEVVS